MTGQRTTANERPPVTTERRDGPHESKLATALGLELDRAGLSGAGGRFANGERGQLVAHASI
jgi:hypothetical protein